MSVRLTILGSGTSHGIPMIACDCRVCTSEDARDKRTRTSAVFSTEGGSVLVDTSPELRLQCLACDVRRIDAVFFTHHHADHVVGLDDLRRFNSLLGGPLPVYANRRTLDALQAMFAYAFAHDPAYPSAKPQLEPVQVDDAPFQLIGRTVTPLPLLHGRLPVLGLRMGDVAYCPDCNRIPEQTLPLLEKLDVLVLDALRRTPHPTHFNLAQALEVAAKVRASRTFLTHMAHELLHAEVSAELPHGVQLAYDGLVIESR